MRTSHAPPPLSRPPEEPQVVARDGVVLVVGANGAGEVVLERLR